MSNDGDPAILRDHAALNLIAEQGGNLCTLVGIDGIWSRRIGAQIAFAPDGTTAGDLTDHCLHQELQHMASMARADGAPRIVRYGRGSEFIDISLPCGAGINIHVDPTPDRDAAIEAVKRLASRRPASLKLAKVQAPMLQARTFVPKLKILCFGASVEAEALAKLAAIYGADFYHLQLTGLSSSPSATVDSWTAIVCLYHDHDFEQVVLPWALDSDAFYIGALGGRLTRAKRATMLESKGITRAEQARICEPIGLVAHTRSAHALAFSIMGELVQIYETIPDQ